MQVSSNNHQSIYTLGQLKEKLTPVFDAAPVFKATLFGSYAKGKANTNSDIDIVIDSKGQLLGLNFFGVVASIEDTLEKKVDVYEISEIKDGSSFMQTINTEGVVFYER